MNIHEVKSINETDNIERDESNLFNNIKTTYKETQDKVTQSFFELEDKLLKQTDEIVLLINEKSERFLQETDTYFLENILKDIRYTITNFISNSRNQLRYFLIGIRLSASILEEEIELYINIITKEVLYKIIKKFENGNQELLIQLDMKWEDIIPY